MRHLQLFFLLIVLTPFSLLAQTEEPAPFTSDLFGGITGVDIMPKGRLQWETHAFYQHSTMFDSKSETWSPNTSVFRYGINGNTELRLQGAWLQSSEEWDNYSGLSDVALGFKTRLFEGWKYIPAVSLRGMLYFPGGDNQPFLPDDFGFEASLMFYNQLTSWCGLGYMGSMEWDDMPHPTIFFGAYLDFFLSDRLVLSAEESNYYYGPDEEERLQPWGSLTLSWQALPRLEVGISSDLSLKHTDKFYDIMLGVAWQLTR